jgi:hypothetical protein
VDIHESSPPRSQPLIQTPAERLDLAAGVWVLGKQAVLWWRALIDPGEDVRRIADHCVGCDEHGNGYPATRASREQLVDALDVALLAIGHSRALECPARLLAVVTDRDREEP